MKGLAHIKFTFISYLLYLFAFFVSLHIHSQTTTSQKELTTEVTGFGKVFDHAKKEFYLQLKTEKTPLKRYTIIDSITQYHIKSGHIDSILYYGDLLHKEVLQLKDSTTQNGNLLLHAYSVIAIGKRSKGLLDAAIKWNLKGISLAEKLQNNTFLFKHKLGLGVVYLKKRKLDKASSLFEECLKYKEISPKMQYAAKKYLGDIAYYQKNIGAAKQLYTDALQICTTHNLIKEQLIVKLGLGAIAQYNKDYTAAFNLYNEVKDIAIQHKFYDLNIDAQINMGSVYYDMEQYQNAELVYSTAYTNTISWDNLYLQERVLKALKELYITKKDYKNVYGIMSQLNRISNELLMRQNQKEIRDLQIKYETKQKEDQINLLKKDQELQKADLTREKAIKIVMLIAFGIILIPIIVLLYVYFQKLRTQHKLNQTLKKVSAQEISSLLKKQELKIMNAVLEAQNTERKRIAQRLHDSVGGNLAGIKLSLSNYAERDKKLASVSHRIDDTYQQIRDISHNLLPQKFHNFAFTALIDEYVSQLSEASDLQITFSPFPEFDLNQTQEDIQVEVYTILQELLTNIMKHAQATNVDIHLNLIDETIQLMVEDDGVGFDTSKTAKGIGLHNIKERVHNLNGVLHIDSAVKRGTIISIDIPTYPQIGVAQ